MEDYLGPSPFIYSYHGNYYQMQERRNNLGTQWSFPPTDRVCDPRFSTAYLTTDGKSYFVNNECNLTKATK